MITIDVCMETVFADQPFCERPTRIADTGFKVVEAWFPELHLKDDIAKLRKDR